MIFGFAFYLGLCLKDPLGFIKAGMDSLARGLFLGTLFWPVGLVVQTYWAIKTIEEYEKEQKAQGEK
jgi:hypothetical protein